MKRKTLGYLLVLYGVASFLIPCDYVIGWLPVTLQTLIYWIFHPVGMLFPWIEHAIGGLPLEISNFITLTIFYMYPLAIIVIGIMLLIRNKRSTIKAKG